MSSAPAHPRAPQPLRAASSASTVLDGSWSCTAVLKEWASACEAIGQGAPERSGISRVGSSGGLEVSGFDHRRSLSFTGEQIILLRKGGIREKGFKVSHRRFALYPSSFHNSEALLQPWAAKHAGAPASTPGDDVHLRFVAECTGLWQTDDPAVLSRLSTFHCWGDGLLETRFKWRPTQPITVVELRAFRLPTPFLLKVIPALPGGKRTSGLAVALRRCGCHLRNRVVTRRAVADWMRSLSNRARQTTAAALRGSPQRRPRAPSQGRAPSRRSQTRSIRPSRRAGRY